jgi:hypothetical protein
MATKKCTNTKILKIVNTVTITPKEENDAQGTAVKLEAGRGLQAAREGRRTASDAGSSKTSRLFRQRRRKATEMPELQ